MERLPVESEALKSVGYDEENEIAEVEIRQTGRVYEYFNVPLEDYLSLIEANSIGEYYNKTFKPKFHNYIEV
ncbi:MAG: hypothetical protein JWQ09_5078 [Segetibacter sp.]|nr:hypothetical protein [Segetibacter sp.]